MQAFPPRLTEYGGVAALWPLPLDPNVEKIPPILWPQGTPLFLIQREGGSVCDRPHLDSDCWCHPQLVVFSFWACEKIRLSPFFAVREAHMTGSDWCGRNFCLFKLRHLRAMILCTLFTTTAPEDVRTSRWCSQNMVGPINQGSWVTTWNSASQPCPRLHAELRWMRDLKNK